MSAISSRLHGTIEEILSKAQVPGAAIGIIDSGEVVDARGFGHQDLAGVAEMTTRTIYPIASTTKAMNATLVAMLIDDGLLAWDRPVHEYLDGFEMPDPAVSRLVTLRDLVSMRTGAGPHDWLWASGSLRRRSDLLSRYRHLPATSLFRETFLYNNLSVLLSGHIAELAAGTTWERLLSERLLEPLGMRETHTARPVDGVVTSYHEAGEGNLVLSAPLPTDVGAPMGTSVHSHIDDMLKWIQFNLAGGEVAGQRLVSASAFGELWEPQILLGSGALDGYTRSAAYAHGWFVDDFRGERRVSHGGYLNEVDSWIMMLPDRRLGVIFFNNAGQVELAKPVAEYALDVMLGREPSVSLDDYLAEYRQHRRKRWQELAAASRVDGAPPSHPLTDYVGPYHHPGYGAAAVHFEGDHLVLQYGVTTVPLTHWHYDSWIAADGDRFGWQAHAFDRLNRLTFDTDAEGRVAGLSIRFEQACPPIRFVRT